MMRFAIKVCCIVALASMLMGLPSQAWSGVIFVKGDASGTPINGQTWPTAYRTIGSALSVATSGDEIRVAAGTYTGNITLVEGVSLRGGFAGDGDTRDPAAYVTTLYGFGGSGSIVTAPYGITSATVIDGFTITNGRGTVVGDYNLGGGIYCDSSSPTISNNIITANNVANFADGYGGGIYCGSGSTAVITGCTISDNNAEPTMFPASGCGGGGIYCASSSNVTITNNTITGNRALYGGGIHCQSCTGTISRNVIGDNHAVRDTWDNVGGLGGGISCWDASPNILSNVIQDNLTDNYGTGGGAGIECEGASAEPVIANNVIWRNSGEGQSCSAIAIYDSVVAIKNNSIVDHLTAIYYGYGTVAHGVIVNNIIAYNYEGIYTQPGDYADHSYNQFYQNGTNYYGSAGTGDQNGDPVFVDRTNGDLCLQSTSPCVDSGSNAAVQTGWLDFEGQPRKLDGDLDSSIDVDRGADELAACTADTPTFSPDGAVSASSVEVTIDCATATTIRYTTDGSDPTESDTSITTGSTVVLSSTTTLKARAWKDGCLPGEIESAEYLIDAIPPTPPGTPDDGGDYTNSSTITFTWTAGSDTGGSGVASYNIQIGTVPDGNDVFDGNDGNVLSKAITGSDGTRYFCRVRTIDGAGNVSDWSASSNGITVDMTPPAVVDKIPLPDEEIVPPTAVIAATFDAPVDSATIGTSTFLVKDSANNPIAGTITYSDRTAIFTPTAPLSGDATYTATVTTGVTDLAGNALPTDATWSFTTVTNLTTARNTYSNGTEFTFGPVYVTAIFPEGNYFYVETEGRNLGIRVNYTENPGLVEGDIVYVKGVIQTAVGERYIDASSGWVSWYQTEMPLKPLGMRNGWLAGESPNPAVVPDIRHGVGFYSVGLLAQTCGAVTATNYNANPAYIYINDGSNMYDGSTIYGVRVILPPGVTSGPAVNDFVKTTGIISTTSLVPNIYVRTLMPRRVEDIVVVSPTDWRDLDISLPFGANYLSIPGHARNWGPWDVFVGCNNGLGGINLNGTLQRYDAPAQTWVTYSVCQPWDFGTILTGEGYLLSPGINRCYHYPRIPVEGDQLISLPRGSSWETEFSLIGNPFDANILWSTISVTNGQTTKLLVDAPEMVEKVYAWTGGQWERVNFATDSMLARRAYKVYPKSGCLALMIPETTADEIEPTCTITGPASPTNGSPITFTFSFSEPVTGLTASEILVTNGTKGTISGRGMTYTIGVTPSEQGDVTCQVPARAAQDAAGNHNIESNLLSITYDSVAPTCVVTGPSSPTSASPISFTITFSEAVTGLSLPEITVTNGTKGTLSGEGTTYTLSVTPGAQGDVTCLVIANAALDAAGNGNTASDVLTITYQPIEPTCVVTGPSSPTSTSPINFTLTFSEAVTGLDVSEITVTNGTKGTLSGSGTTYTLPVTPSAQGDVTCQVIAGAAQNATGSGNTESNSLPITYDSVLPTVTVSSANSATNASPISFTVTFSETVTGLDVSEIAVTNGTKGTLSGSGTTYTLPVTPSAQGDVTCQVVAGAAQDAANNGNTVSNQLSVVYDTESPDCTVTGPSSPTNTSPIQFTLTFTEAVTGLDVSEISVTNGTKGALTGSGTTYTLAVNPITQGNVTCQVPDVAARDAATNANTASNALSISYDSVAPTCTVAGPSSPTNDAPIVFTITFSQEVTGLQMSEITVTNGTKNSLSGSGTTYTLEVTPSAQGAVTCQVPAGVALDGASNGNTASNTLSITYDSQAPGCTVTGPSSPTRTSPITFTLTFTESVTGLTAAEITVTNGNKGTLSGSGTTYTLPVTPSGQGAVTCQVPAAVAQDGAGSDNTASNTASITYDSQAPTCTISGPASPTNSSPITFTITFPEPVTGLTASEITVTNGIKGTFSGTGISYTLQVTPSAQGVYVTCQVPSGVAQDAAGNNNTASNNLSIRYIQPPQWTATPLVDATGTVKLGWSFSTLNGTPFHHAHIDYKVGNGSWTSHNLFDFGLTGESDYRIWSMPEGASAGTVCTFRITVYDSATHTGALPTSEASVAAPGTAVLPASWYRGYFTTAQQGNAYDPRY